VCVFVPDTCIYKLVTNKIVILIDSSVYLCSNYHNITSY
jgi:hypothetical protein